MCSHPTNWCPLVAVVEEEEVLEVVGVAVAQVQVVRR